VNIFSDIPEGKQPDIPGGQQSQISQEVNNLRCPRRSTFSQISQEVNNLRSLNRK
jgi:hypothetical protein